MNIKDGIFLTRLESNCKYRQTVSNIAGTDIVLQLAPSFMRLIERRGADVGDGDACVWVQCEQEDQASSPRLQGVCEQLPLIDRDPG